MRWYKVKLIEEIEKVQKRATKILPGLRNLSYTERLQKLQLPTLVYRRERVDMIKVYQIVQGYYDSECVPYLQPSLYHKTRGHNRKLFKLSHLELRRHCFTVRVVSNWNLLPSQVVNAFKTRLDKHWSSAEFRYDYKAKSESWQHLQLEIIWSGYTDPVVFVQYLSVYVSMCLCCLSGCICFQEYSLGWMGRTDVIFRNGSS